MQFKDWLDKSVNQLPPKTAFGKAIAYSLSQWLSAIQLTQHIVKRPPALRPGDDIVHLLPWNVKLS
tara:strand:+ start:1753 stop:1950 length:198 start_codon:yes stop_codon:yes gene_type:complete